MHGDRPAGRVRPNRRIIALHPTKYGGQCYVGKHPASGCQENPFAFCNSQQMSEGAIAASDSGVWRSLLDFMRLAPVAFERLNAEKYLQALSVII